MNSMMRYRREWLILIALVFVVLSFLGVTALRNNNETTQSGSEVITNAGGASQPAATSPTRVVVAGNNVVSADTIHTVVAGDTLAALAARYSVNILALRDANNLTDANLISVGQQLVIPGTGSSTISMGSAVKIIPDDLLIYGPSARDFSVEATVPGNSYLRGYRDTVEGVTLTGVEVVQLVAERTRVNPQLLLAALDYRSGWVTQSDPVDNGAPMGLQRSGVSGLYQQLEWAANQLNKGYYGRAEGGLTSIAISDGSFVGFSAEINHGTAGVQNWLGAHTSATLTGWQSEASANGFLAAYERLFGNPFANGEGSVYTGNVTQPTLLLPWADDSAWYFTSGPHGGWASGSGWSALDFVPPGDQAGCYESVEWITAVAAGIITRSDFGAVVLDLDGDGYAGTGWVVLYQHVATRNRVAVGTTVQAGDRIGHPSCEGGYSTGTHLHLARTYNGRWISADQPPQFNLGGWIATGSGSEYNGLLSKNGRTIEAFAGRGNNLVSAE